MFFLGGRVSLVPCPFWGVGIPYPIPWIPYSPWDTLLSLGYPSLPGVLTPLNTLPMSFPGGRVSLVPCSFWGYGISGPVSLLRGGYTLPQIPQMPLPLDTLLSLGYPIPWIPYLTNPYPLDASHHGYLTPWIPYPLWMFCPLDTLIPPNPWIPYPPAPATLPPTSWIPYPPWMFCPLDTLIPRTPGYPTLRIPYPPDPYPLDTIPSVDVLPPIYPNPPPPNHKGEWCPSYWYAFLWYVYLIERDFEWNKFDGLMYSF